MLVDHAVVTWLGDKDQPIVCADVRANAGRPIHAPHDCVDESSSAVDRANSLQRGGRVRSGYRRRRWGGARGNPLIVEGGAHRKSGDARNQNSRYVITYGAFPVDRGGSRRYDPARCRHAVLTHRPGGVHNENVSKNVY